MKTEATNEPTIERLVDDARRAVAAVVDLALGLPSHELASTAASAIADLEEECANEMIPTTIRPIGADVLADLSFYGGDVLVASYGPEMAGLLGRALDSGYTALVDAIRSPTIRDRVAKAATTRAAVKAVDPDVYSLSRIRQFEHLIAGEFHLRNHHEPWSGHLAVTVPALERELRAAAERHQKHATAELERIERETREAEEAIANERARRLETLMEFFRTRRGILFTLRGASIPGAQIARELADEPTAEYIAAAEDIVARTYPSDRVPA